MASKGPSFHSQIANLPTDQLLAAYRGERNPFNTKNRLSPEGQQDIQQMLQSRGVNLSGVQVTPGGTIHRSFGQKLGKLQPLKALGQVASKAAPFVSLIPGAGTLAGLALGAGGAALQGKGLGDVLKGGAVGGLAGYGGSQLLGGKGIGGVGSALGKLGGLGQTALGKIGADPLKAAQLGLAGVGAYQGAQRQSQANQINQQLMQSAMGQQAGQNQLQQALLQRMLQGQGRYQPLGAGAAGNPFTQQYGAVGN